jgi:hypothetical protein
VVITTAFVSGNITVKASNACASSAVRTLVLGTCLRSAVLESNSDEVQTVNVLTTLYPNPSNGEFNINYVSAISSDLQLEVYDAQGRKVFEKNEQIVEGENILNYTSILENKGIYFVKLIDSKNNFMETKTLVVQ